MRTREEMTVKQRERIIIARRWIELLGIICRILLIRKKKEKD